jgi:uncharacterized protein with von Willebrand factor type A (vWA) domain
VYPFASLPENLTAFCGVLRHNHGFRIGPRELQDAARALQVAPIGDELAVRDALRPVLSRTVDDSLKFDAAFRAFFYPGPVRDAVVDHAIPGTAAERKAPRPDDSSRASVDGVDPGDEEPSTETGSSVDTVIGSDAGRDRRVGLLRSTYSAAESEGQPLILAPVDAAWRRAASVFVSRVETTLSRRWKPAVRGPRFDLRRTLRASLHTGGEAVAPRWQARPRLRPQFVIAIDGSRSMAPYTASAVQAAVAIAGAASGGVEVFVFSTELRPITRDVRRAAAGDRRVLVDLRHAWAGGTGIGPSLRDLVHRHGPHALGRETVVLVASDGLDLGAPEILRQAMSEIHRRSAAIVWLNPLADTPGYEPTALGMRIARPFVSTFGWAGSAEGLTRLAREVRIRVR